MSLDLAEYASCTVAEISLASLYKTHQRTASNSEPNCQYDGGFGLYIGPFEYLHRDKHGPRKQQILAHDQTLVLYGVRYCV